MFDAYIADLDMCICNTFSISQESFAPVLAPLSEADLPDDVKERVEDRLWFSSLDDTAREFALPPDVVERMREANMRLEVPDDIRSFGDEGALLLLRGTKVLVTSGFRNYQESKIRKLRLRGLFEEVIIDAVDVPAKRLGKKRIFKDLLDRYGWEASRVLVFGDNPDSELSAGRALGMKTAQTLRPNVARWDEADYHVSSLYELSLLA